MMHRLREAMADLKPADPLGGSGKIVEADTTYIGGKEANKHRNSEAHLKRYLAEFDFRYSHKAVNDGERTDIALQGIAGKRLTYRRTAALAA